MNKISLLLTGLLTFALTVTALAGEQAFNQSAFDQAVKSGKPVIVEFAADWCTTCRAQKPIVAELMQLKKMQPVNLFVANFDTESALKKSLHVASQATFVVFKGGKEVDRATGITQRGDIEKLFDEAL